MEILKY